MAVSSLKKLRVYLADDHPLTLAGVQEFLSRDVNIEVEQAVSNSSELVRALRESIPDIVITDYTMPGDSQYGDGIRFVEYLVRNFPEAKILVLTMVSNPMILAELYSAGVWGVLLMHEKLTEITGAIYNVRLGNKYYPQSYSKQEQESAGKDTIEEKVNTLSPREFEVLRLFVRGEGVAQIAQNLNRSVKTVSTQKRSAMKKLGVQTDQDLIAFCVEHAMFS